MLILIDGYARKIHYTADMFFALSWALITGFNSPLPWFYPIFFAVMISHRAYRDIKKCEAKYGEAWQEYKRQVPYLFIPVSVQWEFRKSNANQFTVCVLVQVMYPYTPCIAVIPNILFQSVHVLFPDCTGQYFLQSS